MGSIKFNNLQNTSKAESGYTYTDLHLDLEEAIANTDTGRENTKNRDIRVSYDEAAIQNSIINILSTRPGQRFLIPEFGANLDQYLFAPVTEDTAEEIGETILRAIEDWEPRVTVEHVSVLGKPFGSITSRNTTLGDKLNNQKSKPTNDAEYHVNIIISIPELKYKVDLSTVLTQDGFAETTLNNIE